MLKQKRTWNLIGCILGLVMLIVGLVFLNKITFIYVMK